VEQRATVRALALAARHDAKQLEAKLRQLVTAVAAALLTQPGIGPISAAQLLISWSHPGRFRSEAAFAMLAGAAPVPASSGQMSAIGWDRQLHRALPTIVMLRQVHHGPTRAYTSRRTAEGKSQREIRRCLIGRVSPSRSAWSGSCSSVGVGDGLVAEPPDGQFEFCHPRRPATRRPASGTCPPPGPNNETPAAGPQRRRAPRDEEPPMFVGGDWASATHDVTVIDDAGRILDRWAPEHTETGLDQTLARLARHGRPEQLPVAIERPSGLVVDRLLAAGHPVIPIHPNAFHATRPRWGAAGAKSDPGDSSKLADYLRTDGHRLGPLRPLDAATRQLQALARVRDDHVAAKTAASMKLGALLEAHWPGAEQVVSRLGSQIALNRPGIGRDSGGWFQAAVSASR
jgi:transposase